MPLKILFMGTPNFAVPILEAIHHSNHTVLEVYTQPPNRKNRGQKISFSQVHEYSNKMNIPIRYPALLDIQEELEHIKKIEPDIVIVVAYGKILPTKLLNLENTMFINVHASLLPKWRGAAPIQRAIMNCDSETGISIMKIEPKLDTGPILMKSKIKITKEINHEELSVKMSKLGANVTGIDIVEKNMTPAQTQSAKIDRETKVPHYLKIHWISETDFRCEEKTG